MMKTAIATIAGMVLVAAAPLAAQTTQEQYDSSLSCAAYQLEVAGFYNSNLGKEQQDAEALAEAYKNSGVAELVRLFALGAELGKDTADIQAALTQLIESRIKGNLEQGDSHEKILEHVKNTTAQADECRAAAE